MFLIDVLPGAKRILEVCAGVKKNEQVVLVTDPGYQSTAEALAVAARTLGAEPTVVMMPRQEAHCVEPPAPVVAAMMAADVVLMPTTYSLSLSQTRFNVQEKGVRLLNLSQIGYEQLVSGGVMADFEAQREVVDRIAAELNKGGIAKVTAPSGTDFEVELIEGAVDKEYGMAREPGTFTPCPDIEVACIPKAGTGWGTVVVDASFTVPSIGIVRSPVSIKLEKGKVVLIEGQQQAQDLKRYFESFEDPSVYNLAELGIGLNPAAQIRGNMLEDEGAYGTAHVGFGHNYPLGSLKAPTHFDGVFTSPTIEIGGALVMEDGELVI